MTPLVLRLLLHPVAATLQLAVCAGGRALRRGHGVALWCHRPDRKRKRLQVLLPVLPAGRVAPSGTASTAPAWACAHPVRPGRTAALLRLRRQRVHRIPDPHAGPDRDRPDGRRHRRASASSADRAVREVEALLRTKEAEAAQAARFNLVSSMASALAHEINQPITAARALAAPAQHLLRTTAAATPRVDDNLTTMIAQIDHAASVVRRMREFLRRGEPHISTLDVRTLIDEAMILVRPEAAGAPGSGSMSMTTTCRRCTRTAYSCSRSCSISRTTRSRPIGGRGRSDGRIRAARPLLPTTRAGGDRRLRQRRRHRPGTGGAAVRAAHDLQADGLGLGLSICASIVQSHHGRIWLQSGDPAQPNSDSGSLCSRRNDAIMTSPSFSSTTRIRSATPSARC